MNGLTPAGTVVDAGRNRRRWLRARKSGLGASDTAAVLGLSPWETPLGVWIDKTTDDITELDVEAAEWGRMHEATIARRVNTLHRRQIGVVRPSPGLMRHDEHLWMLATPDRLLADDRGWITGLLEVKTANWRQREAWRNGPPFYYQIQVQQQLAVTGLPVGWLAVLHNGSHLDLHRIDRDEQVIEQVIEYAGRWWREHVETGEPPEPTWPADEASLASAYNADPDTAVEATNSDRDLIARWRHAKREVEIAEQHRDQLAFEIKRRMGDATAVVVDGENPLVTWREHQRRDLDKHALKADEPSIYEKYLRTTTVRTLRDTGKD